MKPNSLEKRSNIELEERRTRSVALHKEGYSFEVIAQRLGVSRTTIFKDVQKVLVECANESKTLGKAYIEQECKRLDDLLLVWLPKAKAGDPKAFDCVQKIMERRSKYRGYDAPTEVKAEHSGELGLVAAMQTGSVRAQVVDKTEE